MTAFNNDSESLMGRFNSAIKLANHMMETNPNTTKIPEFFQMMERKITVTRVHMLDGDLTTAVNMFINAVKELDDALYSNDTNFQLPEIKVEYKQGSIFDDYSS